MAAARLAARQGGVLTRADALALGFTPPQVATALRSGRWSRVAYGAAAPVGELPPEGSPRRVALEVAAAVRTGDRRLVAAGETAALLHGLPLLGPRPARPYVVLPDGLRHDVPGAPFPPGHVVRLHGVAVTSLARTVVDVARRRGVPAGVVAADAALLRGVSAAPLLAACAGWRGVRAAREAVALARPGAESPLESLGRLVVVRSGLPEPELQVEVRDARGFVGRVDQLWRAQRVVGEADGMGKYTEPGVLRAEKLREDRLRDLGLEVVRYTWDEVLRTPDLVVERVRRAFGRAARAA